MTNPFDWDYLTSAPVAGEIIGPFSALFLLLFASGFIAAAYLYYRPWTRPVGDYIRRKTVRKASSIALWVFGTGLFFFLIRLLQINPFTFGQRIWIYLCFLAFLIMMVLFAARFKAAREEKLMAQRAQANNRRRVPQAKPVSRPVRRRTHAR
jgi:drug/metabolite transporter (DMT)-like permease